MGENIGAAARAMWNFGLERMVIVAPRDGWPNPRAIAMATGAGRLLDDARLVGSVSEAVAGSTFVYATTARSRELKKDVLTPQAAMQDAAARISGGQDVAVLFGPERAGLQNDDVARANAIVSVPVNPEFPSLNLAQCVLLTAYEWRRAARSVSRRERDSSDPLPASHAEVEHLASHYEDCLQDAGFFFPPEKASGMKLVLRNLWSRMPLTSADVQVFHGILRQMVRWKERGD